MSNGVDFFIFMEGRADVSLSLSLSDNKTEEILPGTDGLKVLKNVPVEE